ncbi:MAG: hypothetical protein RBS86_04655 [Candidatus Moranbacteria bacterium]|jgi:hypothetical protein|nr:hypothetical protein [Candidatus Moranbacteria bacterium]
MRIFNKKDNIITPPIRKWTNDELRKMAHLFEGDIVNVYGWEDKDKECGFYRDYFKNKKTYSITNHSVGHRYSGDDLKEIELDLIEDLPLGLKNKFDVVFNHTTLEHIFEINKAFENLCAMSRDIVIVVVPFIQQQHEAPKYNFKDYWRFTPSCLRRLFKENKFEVIYEAINNEPNVINYLFFVGTRDPKKWIGKMPKYDKLEQVCSWVS